MEIKGRRRARSETGFRRFARLCALLLLMQVGAAAPALAAGGAHIVDDAAVVEPGTCQIETWAANFVPGGGYINATPACTFQALPKLEIGATYQHYWESPMAGLFGPAVKLNLRPEKTGVGVALDFTAGVDPGTGDLALVSLIVPVTVAFNDKVRINLNTGWSYVRADPYQNAAFYGAQVEADIGFDIMLMVEIFGRAPGFGGAQMGLRWTPAGGPIDLELLAGGFFDEINPRFFTFGVTARY